MSNHIIYKQTATIEIANQQQASKIHEQVSDVLKYELPALLETLFDELAGDDQIIRIDALTVDLKTIAESNFKYSFKEQLFKEIEKALIESKMAAGADNNVTIIPKQESGPGAFIYFLQHGLKPWYVSAKTMKAWAADLTVQFTDAHWQRLADWIKTHYDPVIIERLVQQCPEEILLRLTEELSGFTRNEWQPVFRDLLALYNLFTGKPKESSSSIAWKDSFIAFIKNTTSSGALYTLIKEAYLQRQIKTDITRPVEIQQIQSLLHSEIVQQTTLRLAADIEKETYLKETKKDTAIDVVVNVADDINASAEIIEDTHTAGEVVPGKELTEDDSFAAIADLKEKDIQQKLAEENLHAEDTSPAIKNDNIHSKEQDILKEKPGNTTEDKISSKEAAVDAETTYNKEEQQRQLQKQAQKKKRPPAIAENEPQYVNNCGVIILHPFLQKYLAELGLIKERAFVSMEACKRAVSLLHFLASGETEITEFDLLLQKLLCNLPLEETLPGKLDISDKEKEESEDLLRSVINYWPPLKNTSVAGLRNTFLQREGKLEKKEAGWLLRVEQKTVDILLDKLPWGFSTIRLPWMAVTISVEWC